MLCTDKLKITFWNIDEMIKGQQFKLLWSWFHICNMRNNDALCW